MTDIQEKDRDDQKLLGNKKKEATEKEKKCLQWTSVILPMVYSIVAFLCVCILVGMYNSRVDPDFEESSLLIQMLSENQQSPIIWNITAVNEKDNCVPPFEKIPVGILPQYKDGCICEDDITKLADPARCANSEPTCKLVSNSSSLTEPYIVSGGWTLCANRYKEYKQLFDDDLCPENTTQFGRFCVDGDKPPITSFKFNISIQRRLNNATNTIQNFKVINFTFVYLNKSDSKNNKSTVDKSHPVIGVQSEIAHRGQRPCLNPNFGPDISVAGVKPYPLFNRSYTGCDKFGKYPEDYSYDTDLLDLERRGSRFVTINVTLENFLKDNDAFEQYAALPFFTHNNTFINNNTLVRYYTVNRFEMGDRRICQEIVHDNKGKLYEVPKKVYIFGVWIAIIGSLALFFLIVAVGLIIAYWFISQKSSNPVYKLIANTHKRKIHIAIFSFTIISSVIIFILGVYFFAVAKDMYQWKRLLSEDCVVIPAFKIAVQSFVDFLIIKFTRLGALITFLFVWSILYILAFAAIGIVVRVKYHVESIFELTL